MGLVCHPLLPTRTSQFSICPSGRFEIFFKASSHVVFTSWMKGWDLLMMVSVILSLVSLLLMALYHLHSASSAMCCTSCIMCLHCRTHTRWATFKMIICRRCEAPGVFLLSPLDPADSSRSRHLIVSLSLVFGLLLSNVLLSKGSKSPSFSPSSSLISITFTQPIFPYVLYPFTMIDYPHSG